jgi:hypothetical protein
MAIMTKEEHQADIDRRKAANLARAKTHYADKVYADPRPPAEKLVHRLTTDKPKEE